MEPHQESGEVDPLAEEHNVSLLFVCQCRGLYTYLAFQRLPHLADKGLKDVIWRC